MTSGGRKPHLPPERKKSELICLKTTPDQYRAFRTLGDRYWLRSVLDEEISKGRCECGSYHGNLPCLKKER